jgi:uncharacterized protein YdeI (YjbR/CyaY-like superfamily)
MVESKLPESWLVCHNLGEWHDWLVDNHATQTGIWVQIKKAKSKQEGISLGDAVEEALCYGWIDSRMYSVDSDRFVLRFTPRRSNSPWSLINRTRAESLIDQGRMTPAGMKAISQAKKNGKWDTAYTSKKHLE